jgi:SAM-dependent methyltransferase
VLGYRLMSAELKSVRLSWRDPDGFVIDVDGRILRAVAGEKEAEIRELLAAPWVQRLIAEGALPGTVVLENPPPVMDGMDRWLWLEHDTLLFPCYPHEISALQLFDAGRLTLRVAIEAAEQGWMLKDASAWNVLFSQGRAVFVDLLSFERPREMAGQWAPYGQFVRHFLLPLHLYRKVRITPADIFTRFRDGVTPERAYELLKGPQLVSLTSMELVVLPKWLSKAGGRLIESQSRRKPSPRVPDVGMKLVSNTLRRLQRLLEALRPDSSTSESKWGSYEEDRHHYTDVDLAAKREFVQKGLADSRTVLDLGCNAGEFSLLAAEKGRRVVAADSDHPALSRLYARIRDQRTLITPVVLDVARPTPAVGWQNREVASFFERATGHFDCILFLGLIHHMLVSERASLPMLVNLLHSLKAKTVILEWVGTDDPKFRQLAGLNGALYSTLNTQVLEECFANHFRLVEKLTLPCNTRVMYSWEVVGATRL